MKNSESAHGISIVIPAYNEEAFLPATLTSINMATQHFFSATGIPVETVVVDNASTDKTAEVAKRLGAVVVRHEVRNISSVRNAGIRFASKNLIVTIDADCLVPEAALLQIWALMEDDRHIGGALGVKFISEKLVNKFVALLIQEAVVRVTGIYGAMFCFWKEDALTVGGFPENLLVAEDSGFAIAMRKLALSRGKKFGRFKYIQIGTLDRKEINLAELPALITQVLRAFFGAKQTPDDLKYWYEPKR